MAVPTLTPNSPVAGSISWSAFTIRYGGVSYAIPASSTAKKYVWWVYNGGSPILTADDAQPTNLTSDDIILFVNKSGIPINVPASSVVDGSLIVDGTVVAQSIAVGALDGKRIIAPLIETNAATARGIKLVNQSLIAYDAAGAATFALNGSTGAVTMVGPLLSNGSITGTTIETTSTAARGIKIVGSVMTAYDGLGNARFVVNGSTGDVTMTGKLFTAPSGSERVEIGTTDASEANFFSAHASEITPARITADVANDLSGTPKSYLLMESGSLTGSVRKSRLSLSSGDTGLQLTGSDRLLLSTVKTSGQYIVLDNDGTLKALAVAGLTMTGGEVGPTTTGSRTTLLAASGKLHYIGANGANPAAVTVAANTVDLDATTVRANSKSILVVEDAAWIALPLNTGQGFTNQGAPYELANYRKIGGRVYLKGLVKCTGYSDSSYTVGTLPAGYRPANTVARPVTWYPGSGSELVGTCYINSSGQIKMPGNATPNAYVFLDNVEITL